MSLRDMLIDIDFDIDYRDIKKADDAVDKLGDETQITGDKMDRLGKKSKSTSGIIRKLGTAAGALGGMYALGRGIKFAVSEAASLEEQTSKFGVVFGEFSNEANQWAEEYADRVGRSAIEVKGFIAENQNLLVGFGATREMALGMSQDIHKLSVDLASFNDIQDATAANNIRSVLLGQHQAGKQLGLAITEASLSQLALNEGYEEAFRNLDPLTKMQLRYKLMVQQSQDSIGDAERTAGSYTNQMKRLGGTLRDAAAEAGMELIPTLRDLVATVNDNSDSIKDFIIGGVKVASVGLSGLATATTTVVEGYETLKPLVLGLTTAFVAQKVINTVSAGYGALAAMQTVLGTSTKTATVIQWGWNAALTANPIGLTAMAIGGLIGALKLLGNHFEWAKNLWDNTIGAVWDKVKGVFGFQDTETNFNANVVTKDIPGYADGTSSAKRGLSIVGENGPELKFLQGGEQIVNNDQTKKLFNSSRNNNNIVINVYESENARETGKEVRREIDNYFKGVNLKGEFA